MRLDAYLVFIAEDAFSWGSNDCALFACNVVRELTGVYLGQQFRVGYHTKTTAYAALKRFAGGGLETLAEKLAAEHGLQEVPVRMAQRGDIVLLEASEGPTLAIVGMDGIHVTAPGPAGLVRWPLERARRAWRI